MTGRFVSGQSWALAVIWKFFFKWKILFSHLVNLSWIILICYLFCYFNRVGKVYYFYSENGLEVTFGTTLQNRNL